MSDCDKKSDLQKEKHESDRSIDNDEENRTIDVEQTVSDRSTKKLMKEFDRSRGTVLRTTRLGLRFQNEKGRIDESSEQTERT